MLQISVGDGWVPYIVRPLVGNDDPATESSATASVRAAHWRPPLPFSTNAAEMVAAAGSATAAARGTDGGGGAAPAMNRLVALFFLLAFFVAGICLMGVVHAILLDEFMVAMQEERQRLNEEEIDRRCITSEKLGSPLDPLLASLAHFHSSSDLSNKIKELFLMIDANGRCVASSRKPSVGRQPTFYHQRVAKTRGRVGSLRAPLLIVTCGGVQLRAGHA